LVWVLVKILIGVLIWILIGVLAGSRLIHYWLVVQRLLKLLLDALVEGPLDIGIGIDARLNVGRPWLYDLGVSGHEWLAVLVYRSGA
jgi:hypothetical protein